MFGCASHSLNTKGNDATSISAMAGNMLRRDSIEMDSLKKREKLENWNREMASFDTLQEMIGKAVSKKILYNLYEFHSVILKEPFNTDSALAKLFPGNYYKFSEDDMDTVKMELWSCKACAKYTFFGWGSDSAGDIFPYRDSNDTRAEDTILIKDNGKRSIIISFGTNYFEGDILRTGRTRSAFLGLALFTEENNKWVLKAFNPGIGFYGMFQQVPTVHAFKFSTGNIGCYIGNTYGTPGDEYNTDGYIFAVLGNTFKIVLEQKKVVRGNTPRNTWDSWQDLDSSQLNKTFPDIIMTTEGDYLKADFDSTYGDDTTSVLSALKPYILAHKDNFDFTVKARYTFTGEKYKLLKESVTTTPHSDSTDDKNFKAHW